MSNTRMYTAVKEIMEEIDAAALRNVSVQDNQGINRIEVIGMDGREFVRYLKDDERMVGVLQDDNRTLKIFIEEDE